jgi:hypothetical protein
MRKNKFYILGMPALLLVFGAALILGACVNPATPGTETAVTALDLTGLLAGPKAGGRPGPSIDGTQYTGSVVWKTAAGASHTGAFTASTAYRAELTLTAKSGFTFTGLARNSFTYTGATEVTNSASSGTVTISFPATGVDTSGPGTGLVKVEFTGPQDETITLRQEPEAISWHTNTTLTVSVSDDFTAYRWPWTIQCLRKKPAAA